MVSFRACYAASKQELRHPWKRLARERLRRKRHRSDRGRAPQAVIFPDKTQPSAARAKFGCQRCACRSWLRFPAPAVARLTLLQRLPWLPPIAMRLLLARPFVRYERRAVRAAARTPMAAIATSASLRSACGRTQAGAAQRPGCADRRHHHGIHPCLTGRVGLYQSPRACFRAFRNSSWVCGAYSTAMRWPLASNSSTMPSLAWC